MSDPTNPGTPPSVTTLGPFPSRTAAEDTYDDEMDAALDTLEGFPAEQNAVTTWQVDMLDYAEFIQTSLETLQTDVNTSTGANVTAAEAAQTAAESARDIAEGFANYQGDYDAGTLYAIGESVTYLGSEFVKKTSAAAGTTPVDGTDWRKAPRSDTVGDYLRTARSGAIDRYLLADGTAYLQASYPDLFGVVGLEKAYPPIELSDPATLPPSTGRSVSWTPDNTYLTVAHNDSPFITTYKRSGNTFTKLADPATLPAGVAFDVAWSSDGTYLTVAHQTSPFITIYKRSGDTLTKLANPATLPTGNGFGAAWSSDGTYLTIAHSTTPFITIYKRSGDTFTKLADPATLPSSTGNGVAWSSDDAYLTIAHDTSPFITIYNRDGDTFTKIADPATLPGSGARGVAWSPSGVYMPVAETSSPYLSIYSVYSFDADTEFAVPDINPDSGQDNIYIKAV